LGFYAPRLAADGTDDGPSALVGTVVLAFVSGLNNTIQELDGKHWMGTLAES
jgi:hypothetical protein